MPVLPASGSTTVFLADLSKGSEGGAVAARLVAGVPELQFLHASIEANELQPVNGQVRGTGQELAYVVYQPIPYVAGRGGFTVHDWPQRVPVAFWLLAACTTEVEQHPGTNVIAACLQVTLYTSIGYPYRKHAGALRTGYVLHADPCFGESQRPAFADVAVRWGF